MILHINSRRKLHDLITETVTLQDTGVFVPLELL